MCVDIALAFNILMFVILSKINIRVPEMRYLE